jgi:uncharacterized phiE125 gp8 family phage protein
MIRIIDYTLKTPALTEPVTLAEAKLHLRVDHDSDDTLILALVQAARESVESYTGRTLVSSSYYGYADTVDAYGWELTKCPVTSVTAITYKDENNAAQTWAATNYILNSTRTPARIGLSDSSTTPSTYGGNHDWTIEFICGYANAAQVPAAIKAAMLLMLGHLYEHRESVVIGVTASEVPMTVKYLLDPYIIWR